MFCKPFNKVDSENALIGKLLSKICVSWEITVENKLSGLSWLAGPEIHKLNYWMRIMNLMFPSTHVILPQRPWECVTHFLIQFLYYSFQLFSQRSFAFTLKRTIFCILPTISKKLINWRAFTIFPSVRLGCQIGEKNRIFRACFISNTKSLILLIKILIFRMLFLT